MEKDDRFAEKIIQFTDLLAEMLQYYQEGQEFELTLSENSKRFSTRWREILDELVRNPGKLIYIEDKSQLKRVRIAIDILVKSIESEDVFDEMIGGDYTSLMVNIMGEYTDRIKLLRPIFISSTIDREFEVYFEETVQSWLLGQKAGPLILVCSLLENIIKTKLEEIDESLVYYSSNGRGTRTYCLDKLIQHAKERKLLSRDLADRAFKIKNLRNRSVHNLKSVGSEEAYKALMDIIEIVEYVFSDG